MAIRLPHRGSWGLPDFGATEWLAKLRSGGRTTELIPNNLVGPNISLTRDYMGSIPLNRSVQTNSQSPVGTTGSSGVGLGGVRTPPATVPTPGPYDNIQVPPPAELTDVDQIYSPLFEALSTAEQSLRAGQPAIEEQYKLGHEAALGTLAGEETKNKELIAAQRAETGRGKQNALQQARQLYNELQQGMLSRFGAGSSTGAAAQEILGKENQKIFAAIEENTQSRLARLDTDLRLLGDFVTGEKMNLQKQYDNALRQSRDKLKNDISLIQTQRFQFESDRSARKIDAVNTYRQNLFNFQLAKSQYEADLKQFEQQQRQAATAAVSAIPGFFNPAVQGQFNSAQEATANALSPAFGGSPLPAVQKRQISYRAPLNWWEEEPLIMG